MQLNDAVVTKSSTAFRKHSINRYINEHLRGENGTEK